MRSAHSYRISLQKLHAVSCVRAVGYVEAMMKAGRVEGDNLFIAPDDYERLRAKYTIKGAADNWPLWALVVSLFAAAADRGLGDTLRRELGGIKTERFKRWHEATFGLWSQPCGCGKIKHWNVQYPYN